MKNALSIILILILTKFSILANIISIPFQFKKKENRYLSYNTKTFLNEFFKDELILGLNMGTPNKTIDCIINQNSPYFSFYQKNLKDKPLINNYYSPSESLSFEFDSYMSKDFFNFNGTKENIKLNFILGKNSNNVDDLLKYKFLPEIGVNPILNSKNNIDSYPDLIYQLKHKKIIDVPIYTIKYCDKNRGEFIIGNDLIKYDLNYSSDYEYIKINFKTQLSFQIDNILAINKSDSKIIKSNLTNYNLISNEKEAILNINSGFIIGTEDFMNYIEEIYFKKLIEKSICQKDLVKLEEDEESKYYIFNCHYLMLQGKDGIRNYGINYYENFPRIEFNSKIFENKFELTNQDLFENVFSKFYFLIIFKYDNSTNKEKNNIWHLGQPFFRKNPFSINYDSKTIGFYFKKDNINDIKNKISKMENNEKLKTVIKYIGAILILSGALYGAYYIGLKVREGRRKRANELKDDDYEYISETNKDINGNENDNKAQKILELNTKFGF